MIRSALYPKREAHTVSPNETCKFYQRRPFVAQSQPDGAPEALASACDQIYVTRGGVEFTGGATTQPVDSRGD